MGLDGIILDAKYYTATEGSTIITLKAEYVATLSAGEHLIEIVSESGTAEATFTINPILVDDPTEPSQAEEDPTEPSQAEEDPTEPSEDKKNMTSPETGNNENAVYFAMLFALCGAGIITTSVFSKRKKHI